MGLTQRRVVLVKTETTRGVDAVPTAADNAILCRTSTVISPQGEDVTRDNVRATFSPEGHIVTGLHTTLPIEIDLRGSGVAGVAPEFGPLLKACGMAEAVVADTSVAYTPVSESPDLQPSVTIYWLEDGLLHKMVGCVGTWSVNNSVKSVGVMTFNMTGLWVDPENVDLPTPILSDVVPPVVESMGLKIGDYTPAGVSAFTLDFGATVSTRTDVNASQGIAGFYLSARTPAGSIDPEVVAFDEFNPWSDWKAGTRAAISATVGSVAGNICDVAVTSGQYKLPSYGDKEGLRTYSLPFECKRLSAGDDELSLTFK